MDPDPPVVRSLQRLDPVGGGEDVNGNKGIDSTFGTSNTGGDGFAGPTHGPEATGIAVYSFCEPVGVDVA